MNTCPSITVLSHNIEVHKENDELVIIEVAHSPGNECANARILKSSGASLTRFHEKAIESNREMRFCAFLRFRLLSLTRLSHGSVAFRSESLIHAGGAALARCYLPVPNPILLLWLGRFLTRRT